MTRIRLNSTMRTPATLFAALVLFCLPIARADRPAIEKALADMSHAANLADVDAYGTYGPVA